MENIAKKLKELRASRNLTLMEAAKLAGFKNFQTLGKIENGLRGVRTDELVSLSKAYVFDINFFLLDKPKPSKARIFWRSNPNPPKDTSANNRFALLVDRYLHLGRLLNLPDDTLDLQGLPTADMTFEKASRLGEKYSEILRFGNRPALSMISILENECNLPIFYLEMPKDISAISLITDNNAAIGLNSIEPSWRQKFDVAHELFHILNRKSISDNCGKNDDSYFEKYANAFASALLLPRGILDNEIDIKRKKGDIGIPALIAIACDFGISLPALLWRLVNIGRMKKKDVEDVLATEAVRDYNKLSRKNKTTDSPHISHKYVSRVFEAVSSGHMSKMRAAEYLDVSISKLAETFQKAGLTLQEESDIEVAIM